MAEQYVFQIWPGSASVAEVTASTFFNFYDTDVVFLSESVAATEWAAHRLGYPVQDIELTNVNFISMFEEAVSEYGAQINANNIKEYMLTLQGSTTESNLSGREVRGGLGRIIRLAEAYGSFAGAGGNVSYYTGSIQVTSDQQNYDLDTLWSVVSESGNSMRIKRIFHDRAPASSRYFDPLGVPMSAGAYGMGSAYGFGGGATSGVAGTSYLLRPIYEDLLRMQAIEFNDMFRKSAYSFELVNNKLRIFPIPNHDFIVWFHYTLKAEEDSGYVSGSAGMGKITDQANIPYQELTYSYINSVGTQWIRRYFLALCKITLGGIRAKYANIPIPNAEIALDGESLRTEGQNERQSILEELKDMLEKSGKNQQMQRKADEEENMQKILSKVPLGIYVY